MKRLSKKIFLSCLIAATLTSCMVVRPGEVGVRQRLGKIRPEPVLAGVRFINPFTTYIRTVNTRSTNVEMKLDLPSKEGLTIRAEVSIIYHVKADFAPRIVEKIGYDYERSFIQTTLRSSTADVASQHLAKDMHSTERGAIEIEIMEKMNEFLNPRGFVVEIVLLKSIILPDRLSDAIQNKLEAEQRSQQMEFVLTKERQEAERRIIEAEGIRDAQKIINEGLSEQLIQWQTLETFEKLSKSNNAKVIITDGKSPLLIGK